MSFHGDASQATSEGWCWVVPYWDTDHKPERIQWAVFQAKKDRDVNRMLMASHRPEYDDDYPGVPRAPDFSHITEESIWITPVTHLEYWVGGTPTSRRSGIKSFGKTDACEDDGGRTCYRQIRPMEFWEQEEVGVPVWGF